ncbi:MAG: hypothetical protein Tp1111DCM603221_37 [Prokaryotic dsDNA virus sp.]|nr:MAG: hypothetical protein Tp1111DCM603221_37 [Prokaryotic dsDNA virus sp.]|tara:strand:+ start:3575 stop:5719 length:2145 start_codon:yes stop_codon:yes gene_type:complete
MDPRLKLEVPKLGGVEEILPQPNGSATKVENFTVDPATGGWDNRIGYEKFFPNAVLYQPFTTEKRIHSLYIWSTHNGARTYHLFESENIASQRCNLRYTVGNPGSIVEVDEFRRIPTLNEPVTDYEPFGRYLIIVNGHDKPLKFDGEKDVDNVLPLGWDGIPGAVTPWRPDPANSGKGQTQCYGITHETDPNNTQNAGVPLGFIETVGLGSLTANAKNSYKWKVSFVSETGSESPLSSSSGIATWTNPGSNVVRQAVFLDNLAIGPKGTVARRIYRTKNLGDSSSATATSAYYLVAEIKNNTQTSYSDYKSDSLLVVEAPSVSDSVIFPAPGARFAATFKNCLFLDGGQADPTRIYYSNPLNPDSFSASDYFDVGVRDGGDVTGLFAYYNSLILFRESSIELVRGDPVNGFSVVPFIQGVGSRAINSVTAVPGVGIMFLGNDGVYRIFGGLDGGSEVKIEKMSPGLVKTEKRFNPALLARASATYSPKWREWHCYMPVDGEEKPSFGLVYHVDKNAWSTRTTFPVGCIASDQNGELVFGHNNGKDPSVTTNWETGLFVISRKRINGYNVALIPGLEGVYEARAKAAPVSVYKSNWMDMGKAAQKKFVKYVYLHVMTKGDNVIPLKYFKDFDYDGITSSGEKMQRPDHPDQNVFDTAIWDTAVWEDPMFTTIRYPIALSAASFFAFEVETNNDFVLVGYSLEFAANKTHTIKGKR